MSQAPVLGSVYAACVCELVTPAHTFVQHVWTDRTGIAIGLSL